MKKYEKDPITRVLESLYKTTEMAEKLQNHLNQIVPKEERVKFEYKVIPESEIEKRILMRAKKIIIYCKKKLKLDDIQINWVEPAFSEDEAKGYMIYVEDTPIPGGCYLTDENKVFLRADAPLSTIEIAIGHELHHAWFKKKYGDQYPYEKDSFMWEESADAFARKILRELWDLEHQDYPWPITFLGKN